MRRYRELDGRRRRRHLRLLREVLRRGVIYVRRESEFRMVERLHHAGLVTACTSKWNLFGLSRRPFRELAVFSSETEARRRYDTILVRRRGPRA